MRTARAANGKQRDFSYINATITLYLSGNGGMEDEKTDR
jgi:hypothetical protein